MGAHASQFHKHIQAHAVLIVSVGAVDGPRSRMLGRRSSAWCQIPVGSSLWRRILPAGMSRSFAAVLRAAVVLAVAAGANANTSCNSRTQCCSRSAVPRVGAEVGVPVAMVFGPMLLVILLALYASFSGPRLVECCRVCVLPWRLLARLWRCTCCIVRTAGRRAACPLAQNNTAVALHGSYVLQSLLCGSNDVALPGMLLTPSLDAPPGCSRWEGGGDNSDAASTGLHATLTVPSGGSDDDIDLSVTFDDPSKGSLSATLRRTGDAGRLVGRVRSSVRQRRGVVEAHVTAINANVMAVLSTVDSSGCAWCDVPWHAMMAPWVRLLLVAATVVCVVHLALIYPRIAVRYDRLRRDGGVIGIVAGWLGITIVIARLRLRQWSRADVAPLNECWKAVSVIVILLPAYVLSLTFSIIDWSSHMSMVKAGGVDQVLVRPLGSWRMCGPTAAMNVTCITGESLGECACWERRSWVGRCKDFKTPYRYVPSAS